MGLDGTYNTGAIPGFELNITSSDVSTGSFSGEIHISVGPGKHTLPIEGNFHFLNSHTDPTLIRFRGMVDNGQFHPGIYVGYAGTTSVKDGYKTIQGYGGLAMANPDGTFGSIPLGALTK